MFWISGIASTYPQPEDLTEFISEQMYDYNYDDNSAIPKTWEWPDLSEFEPNP